MSDDVIADVRKLIQQQIEMIDKGYVETARRISQIGDERKRNQRLHAMLRERAELIERTTKPLVGILAMVPPPPIIIDPAVIDA